MKLSRKETHCDLRDIVEDTHDLLEAAVEAKLHSTFLNRKELLGAVGMAEDCARDVVRGLVYVGRRLSGGVDPADYGGGNRRNLPLVFLVVKGPEDRDEHLIGFLTRKTKKYVHMSAAMEAAGDGWVQKDERRVLRSKVKLFLYAPRVDEWKNGKN